MFNKMHQIEIYIGESSPELHARFQQTEKSIYVLFVNINRSQPFRRHFLRCLQEIIKQIISDSYALQISFEVNRVYSFKIQWQSNSSLVQYLITRVQFLRATRNNWTARFRRAKTIPKCSQKCKVTKDGKV